MIPAPIFRSRQSKWGRHCCRPHSHRCVVMSEDRNLASDVFPFGCPKASVRFFHRRSHRHPAPPSCLPGRVRQVRRPSLLSQADHQWAAPRSRFPLVADCLERLHRRSGPKTFSSGASSAFDRVGPIHETRPLRSRHRPTCIRPKSSACRSRETHGQLLPCLSGVEFLLNFRSLDHLSGGASSPFR